MRPAVLFYPPTEYAQRQCSRRRTITTRKRGSVGAASLRVQHSLCDIACQKVTQCVAPDDGQVPAALGTPFSSVRPAQLGWINLETARRLCMVHAVSGTVGGGWRWDTQAHTWHLVPPVARGRTFFLQEMKTEPRCPNNNNDDDDLALF